MVYLYVLDVSVFQDEQLFARIFATLPPWRQEKVRRCLKKEDAYLSLGCGYILQQGFIAFGVDITSLPVCHNTYGKPSYALTPPVYFNLSHAGTWACGIFSNTADVGLDVEILDVCPSVEVLQQKILHVTEYAQLRKVMELFSTQTARMQKEFYYKIWTLKESYLKALGCGFIQEPSAFSLPLPLIESLHQYDKYTMFWAEQQCHLGFLSLDNMAFVAWCLRSEKAEAIQLCRLTL